MVRLCGAGVVVCSCVSVWHWVQWQAAMMCSDKLFVVSLCTCAVRALVCLCGTGCSGRLP